MNKTLLIVSFRMCRTNINPALQAEIIGIKFQEQKLNPEDDAISNTISLKRFLRSIVTELYRVNSVQ